MWISIASLNNTPTFCFNLRELNYTLFCSTDKKNMCTLIINNPPQFYTYVSTLKNKFTSFFGNVINKKQLKIYKILDKNPWMYI